jgi:hypothetical protein
LWLGIAIELAEEGWAVFGGPIAHVRNEGFDLLTRGIPQVGSTTGIGGLSFHQISIELMLADQKAKPLAETTVAVLMTVVVCGASRFLQLGLTIRLRFPPKLFN